MKQSAYFTGNKSNHSINARIDAWGLSSCQEILENWRWPSWKIVPGFARPVSRLATGFCYTAFHVWINPFGPGYPLLSLANFCLNLNESWHGIVSLCTQRRNWLVPFILKWSSFSKCWAIIYTFLVAKLVLIFQSTFQIVRLENSCHSAQREGNIPELLEKLRVLSFWPRAMSSRRQLLSRTLCADSGGLPECWRGHRLFGRGLSIGARCIGLAHEIKA